MPMFDVECPICKWSRSDCYETSYRKTLCPEGHATVHVLKPSRVAIQTDEAFIGGKTFENLGPTPVTVYSRQELQREMDKRGLTYKTRHVGASGGDKSKHTSRWI